MYGFLTCPFARESSNQNVQNIARLTELREQLVRVVLGETVTTIHDSEKQRARLLAASLGISNQHAIGSLIECWDLCDGLFETCDEQEQSFDYDELSNILFVAFGQKVDPDVLLCFGFVEISTEDNYEIRRTNR